MAVGKKFVVTVAFDELGNAYAERLDLGETFSYADPLQEGDPSYQSAVQVKVDDRGGVDDELVMSTLLNRYVVVFFWAAGDEPDVTSYTVNQFLLDAIAEISNAGYTVPTPD